jgi:hypothetical protein
MTIVYQQWVVTLITVTWQSNELIENLVSKTPELTHHH